ncbi:serine/threonine protein kinase [Chryseobacterium sp. Leaf180]|uniref:PASTA domain-containing protein n=1 Tax=Chryseobacterium sp. Leaf180 TaxID=1736289 RepID=UPI0006FE7246|nr:PASTA domain-containing protein [Chryseobacterium sp. Leaf180]KQR93588.1 serine/threonine protein kinase [Chryseobacterium sp. Leaf180]
MLKSLFNWKVLANLLLAIGVFIGLVYLTFRWLEYHTNHGQEIPVPNVVNKSIHDAVRILDDAGLDYEVDSFKYDPRFRPLQVLQVSPSPGSRVKNGRAITIKVNPKSWAPVAIPDVINKYSGLAFQRLDQVGLKVGDTIFEPSIQKDAVLRILFKGNVIKPGSKIPRFSVIDVVVGSGPMRNIVIPNLVGLTVGEAKAVIGRNLFEVGVVEHEDGGQDDSNIVYYQDPASGDARDQGMQIDLWASKKTPAEMRLRIDQLNSMYRMKIDTTLAPIRYEEVPVIPEPINEPVIPAPRKDVPKADATKVSPVITKTTTVMKNDVTKTAATPAKTTPAATKTDITKTPVKSVDNATKTTADKPKAKKVVN